MSYNDDNNTPIPIAELTSFLKAHDDIYSIQSRIRNNIDIVSGHRYIWAENIRTNELIQVNIRNNNGIIVGDNIDINRNGDNTTNLSSDMDEDRSFLLPPIVNDDEKIHDKDNIEIDNKTHNTIRENLKMGFAPLLTENEGIEKRRSPSTSGVSFMRAMTIPKIAKKILMVTASGKAEHAPKNDGSANPITSFLA
jgi:hypothetical protein